MGEPPIYKPTPEEVQKFRELLEKAIGHTLEYSDAEVEQMARNATDLFWTLRDVERGRRLRAKS